MVLATGAGSLILSHVNDGGFWLVQEYFGLTVPQTFKHVDGVRDDHLGDGAGADVRAGDGGVSSRGGYAAAVDG